MDALLTQIASAVLIGLLSWGASQTLTWYKAHNAQARSAAPPAGGPVAAAPPIPAPTGGVYAAQPAPPTVNYSQVLIHIGILQLVVNIVGLIIGIVVGALFGTSEAGLSIILVLFFGTLVASAMFFIFGLRVDRAVRWRHLSLVALGTIPLTLFVNWLAYTVSGQTLYTSAAEFVGAVIVAFVQTFLSMGIGGGLASLVDPKRRLQAPAAPGAPQYMPDMPGHVAYPYPGNAAYPYNYGPPAAPPSTPLGYPPSAAPYPPGYPGGYPPPAYTPIPPGYPGAPYPPNPAYPSGGYPPSPAGYPPSPAYPPPAAYPPSPAAYPPPPGYPATNPAGYPASPPTPGYSPASPPLTPYAPVPAPPAPVDPTGGPTGPGAGTGTWTPDQPGYSPPPSTSGG